VSAPVIASVYALAGTPGASDFPASYPYAHSSSLFDVTSGSNGSCGAPICTAGTGWAGPTGLGTPTGLAAFTAGGPRGGAAGRAGAVWGPTPGTQPSPVGPPVTLTLPASGAPASSTWSAAGLRAGLSLNTSSGVISGTPTTAGSWNVTVTATDTASGTASA